MFEHYNKITTGYVVQHFEKCGYKFMCTRQNFVALDLVCREVDVEVPACGLDVEDEIYQSFEMIQPKKNG